MPLIGSEFNIFGIGVVNPFSRDLIPFARNLIFKNKTYVCPKDSINIICLTNIMTIAKTGRLSTRHTLYYWRINLR